MLNPAIKIGHVILPIESAFEVDSQTSNEG